MGQKDIVEKNLEDFNDVFADIVNVLLFHGKRNIKPRELKPLKLRSQYKADNSKLHEAERDNAKYWSKGRVKIAIFGLENQTSSDPDMPFRIIAYDGAAYRSQLLDKKSKARYPALSIVLYFGESRWNDPKTIREMIQIPEGLEEYVNDYKVHIFEIAHLTEEQVKLFKSDFQIVADYFVQKRKNKTYIPSQKTIKHVDAVLKFMSVMTGDQRFDMIRKETSEGGNKKMCEILDQIEQRGIKIGEEHMRAENDALRAENDTLSAKNDILSAEKDAALSERDMLNAEVARMKELLARHHIALA